MSDNCIKEHVRSILYNIETLYLDIGASRVMRLLILLSLLFQIQALSVSKNTYQQLFNDQLQEALEAKHQLGLIQRLFPGLKEYGSIRRTDWNEPKKVSQVLPAYLSKAMGNAFGRDYRRGSQNRL